MNIDISNVAYWSRQFEKAVNAQTPDATDLQAAWLARKLCLHVSAFGLLWNNCINILKKKNETRIKIRYWTNRKKQGPGAGDISTCREVLQQAFERDKKVAVKILLAAKKSQKQQLQQQQNNN